jgi:hypothetical protein
MYNEFDEQSDNLSLEAGSQLEELTTLSLMDAVDTLEEEFSIFN